MVIKHQQRAAGLIQVPDSQLETYIPEKDECYLLCCWDFRWDAEECVYLIPKKKSFMLTPAISVNFHQDT